MPAAPFVPAQAPGLASRAPVTSPSRLHSLSNAEIEGLVPQLLPQDYTFRMAGVTQTYKAGTAFYPNQVITLRLLQENYGRRPVYFSTTVGTPSWMGLGRYLTQEGLVLRVNVAAAPDTGRFPPGLIGAPLDAQKTDTLAWLVYRYARLFEADSLDLDPTNRNIAGNLALPFLSLGQAYATAGDKERSLRNFRRAYHLTPSPELARLIESLTVAPGTPGADTARGQRRR